MIRILFVCLGNICRSPMAEAVLADMIKSERLDGQIETDSAGIGNWHTGEPPHYETRAILQKNDIAYTGLTARQIRQRDWERFDYIIGMDEQNINDLKAMHQISDKSPMVAKLMDFVNDPEEENIPDPYYTGNFAYTYQLVSTGCANLLAYIKDKHHL
ncbi:MAG TPA: low molecular weight protein-tyrosine-phosphatase [Bacillota bacterium]|nr:low molecular weight protein-tyrosine-phosphatase [Bacillota bacterium]